MTKKTGKDGLTKHQRYYQRNRARVNEKNAKRNKERRLKQKSDSTVKCTSGEPELDSDPPREDVLTEDISTGYTMTVDRAPLQSGIPSAVLDPSKEIKDGLLCCKCSALSETENAELAEYMQDVERSIDGWVDMWYTESPDHPGKGFTNSRTPAMLRRYKRIGQQLDKKVELIVFSLEENLGECRTRLDWIIEMYKRLACGTAILDVTLDNNWAEGGIAYNL